MSTLEVLLPCDGQTDLFYPVPTRPRRAESGPRKYKLRMTEDVIKAEQAKALCGTCPRQDPCLEMAVQNEEVNGVWGGVNFGHAEEREAFLRARRRRLRK